MNPLLITALASLLPDGGLPDEIVYLPEGNHAITPFVDGSVWKTLLKISALVGLPGGRRRPVGMCVACGGTNLDLWSGAEKRASRRK